MNMGNERPGSHRASILGETRLFGEFLRFEVEALTGNGPAPTRWRPVLLIPGLMAGDASLYPLAARLRSLGHRVFFSGIWCNVRCPRRTLKRLETTLRRAYLLTGRKVVVIGHSLGGLYARELARLRPEHVERIILLGAPLRAAIENSTPLLWPFIRLAKRIHRKCMSLMNERGAVGEIDAQGKPPPGVPETVIYSKSDAVVDWRSCIEAGPSVESIEVSSSHCGLPFSSDGFRAIAERLGWNHPPRPQSARRGDAWRRLREGLRLRHLRLVHATHHAA
jgi:pimeloyl-ACP methyl ester carboxylesterase